MSEGPRDSRQRVRELMGRATLARVRGDKEQALRMAHDALVLEEKNWEVHEFIGDVLMEINRGSDALASFKRARELNPKRMELEDKVARAAVRWAARQSQLEFMNAVLGGRAPKDQARKPLLAGALSLLMPGLGQLYNWQVIKGAALAVAWLVLMMLVVYSASAQLKATRDLAAGLSGAIIWIVLAVVLWAYAITDAVIVAKKTNAAEGPGLEP